jgi:hypothetical protein
LPDSGLLNPPALSVIVWSAGIAEPVDIGLDHETFAMAIFALGHTSLPLKSLLYIKYGLV